MMRGLILFLRNLQLLKKNIFAIRLNMKCGLKFVNPLRQKTIGILNPGIHLDVSVQRNRLIANKFQIKGS